MKRLSKEEVKTFFKKKGYLLALAIVCVGLTVITAFSVSEKENSSAEWKRPQVSTVPTTEPTVAPTQEQAEDPVTPVSDVIVFDAPVRNATVGMAFSQDELCFSQTLGYWCGHTGVDFIGEEGQDCLAVYDGKVESVTRDIASGTVVTMRINDGLTVSYGSLADDVAVSVGDTVAKGQKIGTISDSGYDEFKEGPHVHLTVFEQGVKVDPEKYLLTDEK